MSKNGRSKELVGFVGNLQAPAHLNTVSYNCRGDES